LEERTEAIIAEIDAAMVAPVPVTQRDLGQAYLAQLSRSYEGPPLAGRHLVVDCANGATSFLARPLLEGLGARVTVIHDRPDGRNINRGCGATAPEALARKVVEAGAGLGVAFDGDGDRAIFADGSGGGGDGGAVR